MDKPPPRRITFTEDPPARAIGGTGHVVVARDAIAIPPAGLDALGTAHQCKLASRVAQGAHMARGIAQGFERSWCVEDAQRSLGARRGRGAGILHGMTSGEQRRPHPPLLALGTMFVDL